MLEMGCKYFDANSERVSVAIKQHQEASDPLQGLQAALSLLAHLYVLRPEVKFHEGLCLSRCGCEL
jgi:hypothetical protein